MTMTFAQRLEYATRDLPLVGHLFSCDWNGSRVRRSALLPALMEAGFDGYAPRPPSYQVSLGRAIRAWIAERAAAGERTGLGSHGGLVVEDTAGGGEATRALVRVARTSHSEWILFAIIHEAIDLAELGMDYSTELRVLVHKHTGQLVVTTEAVGAIREQAQAPAAARMIAGQLRPHWEHFKALHTAADLGEMTRAILRGTLHAVGVQEGSGWHFVPRDEMARLTRLRDLIDALPTVGAFRPFTLTLGQIDTAATRRQLALAAHRDFLDQLAAARQDLAAFAARPDGTVRARTIATRLAAYKALKQRAELYGDLLGMQREAIEQQLAALTAQARAIITHAAGADSPTPMLPCQAEAALVGVRSAALE
jgi:hypothetical protein